MPNVGGCMTDDLSTALASEMNPLVASMGHGLFFGVIFSMAALNFFFFLSIRDRSYLYYVFYQLFFTVMIAADREVLETLFDLSNEASRHINDLMFPLTACCFAAFERRFLRTREYAPRFDRLLVAFIAFVAVAFLFVPFAPMSIATVHRHIVALSLPLSVPRPIRN